MDVFFILMFLYSYGQLVKWRLPPIMDFKDSLSAFWKKESNPNSRERPILHSLFSLFDDGLPRWNDLFLTK